jgi:tetratricopeptide (TPR) repeat protein
MKNIVLFFIFLNIANLLPAQDENSSRLQFEKAEFLLFNNEYSKATKIYESLLESDPANKNIWFHLALCYINIAEENKKAIYYLKKIFSSSTLGGYKRENDYYLYLGKLYHIDFSEEQILTTGFKLDPNKPYKNLAISGDGNTLVFLNSLKSENRIYYCRRQNQTWSEAIEITDQLNAGGNSFPSSLSYDGRKLYLTKYDNFESDAFLSTFNGSAWSTMKKVTNINTNYWESHACESKDGKVLYFASNRPGGFGGMDIYFSNWVDNAWGKPVNAGVRINTFLNDDYPLLTNNGSTLIYSSQGFKKGRDGYDVYYCNSIAENLWSEPENIGFPVNTFEDDLTFVPLTEESQAFFNLSLLSRESADKQMATNDLQVLIKGTVGSREKNTFLANTETQIVNNGDGNVISTIVTDSLGAFQLFLQQGDYSFKFLTADKIIKIANFYIPFITHQDTIALTINIDSKAKDEPNVVQYTQPVANNGAGNNASTSEGMAIAVETSSLQPDIKMAEVKEIQSTPTIATESSIDISKAITVQIYAKRFLSKDLNFFGVDSISVYHGKDGLYRYIYGIYPSEIEAAKKIEQLKKMGCTDAFYNYLGKYFEQELVYSKKF